MSFEEAFQDFPIIETERLILRESCHADAESFFQHIATLNHSPFWTPFHDSTEDTHAVIARHYRDLKEQRCIAWAITLKGEEALIGSCKMSNFRFHAVTELGFWMSGEYEGRGIMSEAVKRIIEFGFETMDLERIEATVHPDNIASIRVLEKAGLKREGLLRRFVQIRDRLTDAFMYSILTEEYKAASG